MREIILLTIILTTIFSVFFLLTFVAWRRYLWVSTKAPETHADTCPYSLTDTFADQHLVNVPHQKDIQWLTEVFSRSAKKFPDHIALQIPHTGESLTFAELDARAERVAAALSPFLTGPDQVVAVAMSQNNWQIIASHLGILKAGGTLMFLDTTLPDALITHMLDDAQPVMILTRGQDSFRDLPTLDVLNLPETMPQTGSPLWLKDPTQRLAAIFYTSGTSGMPKGVECPHAGYVNLALSYADYFDLLPGMDATTLTSSLGYDGSISEMYSAWVFGCTVVMLTKEQVRSGPDLVPVLRDSEVTVLFCPPVLLTTLTSTPEVDLPYPLCRYIVPAGESFPSALVEPWTRGRRQVINTYGPTEASTDTSRQSLRPGEPITIGSPFANVTYVILEFQQLRPLPHGEVGELCIGGVHNARGYRNLPEQTDEKFIQHPEFGNLYRTGDKCRIDIKTRRVHFLGRVDVQLKVRGHRVEAQAVEDILQTQFDEIESAVLDYQNQALIAFVVAPSISTERISMVAPAPSKWATKVIATLTGKLPAPSVPSEILLVEKFLLNSVSGKIDRKRLPALSHLRKSPIPKTSEISCDATACTVDVSDRSTAVDVTMEAGSEEVLDICRSMFKTPLGCDDVFADSGGHSILMAQLAQRLQSAGWNVSVRALLTDCNTVRKVARQPRDLYNKTPKDSMATRMPQEYITSRDENAAKVLSVGFFTTMQVLFASLMYSPALIIFLVFFASTNVGQFFMMAGFREICIAGFLLYLLALVTPFVTLIWVMMIKLVLGGDIYKNNVTSGVYPKWSKMHLRIWCIGRLQRLVLLPMSVIFHSAPLMAFILRQLGATVGDNLQCARDAELTGPIDLICIEDDVAIQTGSYIRTAKWSGQNLHIGPIHLKSGCKIGMRSAISNNVTVGRGAWIHPFTPILNDVGSNEMREGAPAFYSGHCTELKRTANRCLYKQPIWFLETLNIFMQVFLDFWLLVIPASAITWLAKNFIPTGEIELAGAYFKITPLHDIIWQISLFGFVTTWGTIVVTSVLNCLFIRYTATPPGLYPSRGHKAALLMYRMQRMNQIQQIWTWTIVGQYLRALAGVRFSRFGASECDTMHNVVPELTIADSLVFWSNGCYTNMLDYGARHIMLRQVNMPRNFFSGNNSVTEHGHLPANLLLGTATPVNGIQFRRQMRSRLDEPLTVVGNPPLKFPRVDFDSKGDDLTLPGFSIFLGRIFLIDIFSIGLRPMLEVLVFVLLYTGLQQQGGHVLLSASGTLLLTVAIMVLLSVMVKKLLVGKWGSANSTPFWSWRHFTYFFAQDCFFAWCRRPITFCSGTVLSNIILRWMGCKIGHRTIISDPMQAYDWNAVSFGNDCVLDGYLQLHTFENMRLQVKRSDIQDRCCISFGATVMGGAAIEQDTTLLPLGLVLKEMSMSTATYEGSPAETVSALTSNHHSFNCVTFRRPERNKVQKS